MKKTVCFALFAFIFALCCHAAGEVSDISCASALVYNVEYDRILYEKDADKTVFPASFTKIMTAVIAVEFPQKPEIVTVESSAILNVTGNNIGLRTGEIVPYDDLVKALLISNANDAALVLANYIAGTTDEFVAMMNAKAKEIGMKKTHFTNPTGMHDSFMETTLSDILVLCKYAYKINYLMETASMPRYDMPATNLMPVRTLITRNQMQSKVFGGDNYDPDIRGINSGSTEQAGYCLATVKEKNGMAYMCIVSGSREDEKNDPLSYSDSEKLYEYAFKSYVLDDVLKKGAVMCEMPVDMSGSIDHAIIVAESSLKYLIPADIDRDSRIRIENVLSCERLDAPVKAGTSVGYSEVYLDGELIGNVPLVTQANIDRSNFLFILYSIFRFLTSKPVLLTVLAAAAVFVTGLIIYVLLAPSKRRKRK